MASNQRSNTPNFRGTNSRDATQRINRRISIRPSFLGDFSRCSTFRETSPSPFADDDLMFDLVYTDYLQALTKKYLVEKHMKKMEEAIEDQKTLQKDNLQKSKLFLQSLEKKLMETETLGKAEAVLTTLEKTLEKFTNLTKMENFLGILEKLQDIFEESSKTLIIENVQVLVTQQFYDEFYKTLLKCKKMAQDFDLESRYPNQLEILFELLKKVKTKEEVAGNMQTQLQNQQSEVVTKLLKDLSDLYAIIGKYEA